MVRDMGGWTGGLLDEQMKRWMDGCLKWWMNGWRNGEKDEWVDVWVDAKMKGWVNE